MEKSDQAEVEYMNELWIDTRLSQEESCFLWDLINRKPQNQRTYVWETGEWRGPNSSSYWIQDDKDNWFYETVLKGRCDKLYYSANSNSADDSPHPEFMLKEIWVNHQKQYEFTAPHMHTGSVFSFVIFMKIPTHWKEQHALPWLKKITGSTASDFQFLMGYGNGCVQEFPVPLSPEDEGRMLFFPAWLTHQVFPFYGTEEERVTISGNIFLKNDLNEPRLESIIQPAAEVPVGEEANVAAVLEEKKNILKVMENSVKFMKEELKQMKKVASKKKQQRSSHDAE